ncbi:MAG: cytochrome c biogenesis protein [Thermoguttaceae bacterium]
MKHLVVFLFLLFSGVLIAAEEPLERVDWSLWRTLPVYDEGRVMPVNTFARQVVLNICGTYRPVIVPDETFLATIGPEWVARPGDSSVLAATELERIKSRIAEMFPEGHRVFEPYELLLSWLVEPEVWEFIPFLPIPDTAYRNEVLLLPTVSKTGRELRAVAPIQLRMSKRFAESLEQAREREWRRANRANGPLSSEKSGGGTKAGESREGGGSSDSGTNPRDRAEPAIVLTEQDQITIRLQNALSAFRNVVPPPIRTTADLPHSFVALLQKGRAEFTQASRSWDQLSRSGLLRLIPESSRFVTNDCFNAIAVLYSQLFRQSGHKEAGRGETGNEENGEESVDPALIESQFNAMLLLLDSAVQECEQIVQTLYSSKSTSNEGAESQGSTSIAIFPPGSESSLKRFRSEMLIYRTSLLNLYRLTQGNVIALFGDGHTLRVLPLLFEEPIRPDCPGGDSLLTLRELGPWTTLNLVLRAGSGTMRRFVDRDFPDTPLLSREKNLSALFGADFSKTLSPSVQAILFKSQSSGENQSVAETGERVEESVQHVNQDVQGPGKSQLSEVQRDSTDTESGLSDQSDQSTTSDQVTASTLSDQPVQSAEESAREILAGILHDAKEQRENTVLPVANSTVEARIAFRRIADAYLGRVRGDDEGIGPKRLSDDSCETSAKSDVRSTDLGPSQQAIDFLSLGRNSRAAQFTTGVALFELALRETASRMEPVRVALLPPTILDEEVLLKTAYPEEGTLFAEYYYQRLEPFYWMWITALGATLAFLLSFVAEWFRRVQEQKRGRLASSSRSQRPNQSQGVLPKSSQSSLPDKGRVGRLRSLEEMSWQPQDAEQRSSNQSGLYQIAEYSLFWIGITLLLLSQGITFLGGAMRTWISGWAPVSNMFETIVLMCFSAACLGLGFTLQPLLGPPFARAWRATAFPRRFQRTVLQILGAICRILLMFLTLGVVAVLSYSEHVNEQGLLDAIIRSFAMNDLIDWVAVCCTLICLVWFIPRFVLTLFFLPFLIFVFPHKDSENDAEKEKSVVPTEQVVNRKMFALLGAVIVLVAGIVTTLNPHDFNPNIRPLAAVLRSNFWLVVHITVIMISYAAGIIAWLLALISLGAYIFGRYRVAETSQGQRLVLQPAYCDVLAPYIRKMIQVALWLLMIGTILGARWADYSWGRFWSWDVKEVWALITLLIFVAVLHGRIARFYGDTGLLIGAVLGAIAIILTWYGFNYVFGIGRHAYTRGDSQWATIVLLSFILLNLLWSVIALFRYFIEKSLVPQKKKSI